jgi:geranylgeranylglycerol-phosphate geranylgeranyltransferase
MLARSTAAISAALRLARWGNALTAAAAVLLGAWWSGWGPPAPIALAALAAIGLTAAANAWNDIADLEIDRIAHPARPLPSGALAPSSAATVAMGAATLAVVAATAVTMLLGLASIAVLVLMRLYSPWLKRAGVPGNLVVALLASLPFLYGSYAAGAWAMGLPLVAIAIPLHLARELAKDLDDREADHLARRTLPVIAGARWTRAAIVAVLVSFGAALALGLAPHARSPLIFLLALVPALLVLIVATARALGGRRGSPAYFKLAMVCAMAALLVARP